MPHFSTPFLCLVLSAGACVGLSCSTDSEGTEREASNGAGGGTMGQANTASGSVDTASIDANGDLLLDSLEDGDDKFLAAGISGEWFSYADPTSEIFPAGHSGVGDTPGEVHVQGQGFTEWGAGLSAYFQSVDLSGFSGFKVRAKGIGTLRVEVATPETSPSDEGGTCEGDTGCFGHYYAFLTLSEEYEDVTLAFESLVQPPWAQQVDLSLSGVISINFLAPIDGGTANIDLWVDELSLVGGTPEPPMSTEGRGY